METTLLSPVHIEAGHADQELEQLRGRAAAALLQGLRGLESLADHQAAAYLTKQPRLFVAVSYFPNQVTAEMIREARALAEDQHTAKAAWDIHGFHSEQPKKL